MLDPVHIYPICELADFFVGERPVVGYAPHRVRPVLNDARAEYNRGGTRTLVGSSGTLLRRRQ